MDVGRHLKSKFLTGFFILIPVIVTVYIVYAVVSSVDGVIYPVVRRLTHMITGHEFFIPGTGLLLLVVIAYVTGVFAANYLGKRVLAPAETLFTKTPLVKSVYSSVKDMTDAFSSQTRKAFKEVVLLEFPGQGSQALGFITTRRAEAGRETICSVFVPTTPNPTSGFLLMVPEGKLTFLHMTVDEALKYIISLGTTRVELK